MARRRKSSLVLSGEQAHQAFALLVDEGKLAVGEIRKALQRRDRLIRTLRARLDALGAGAGSLGTRLFKRSAPVARTAKHRRKPRISAATRALYRQQGRYMAAVRQLPKAARAKIKAIREKSGVRAAIAAAKRIAK